jgi:hypothetical protein
MEVLASAASNNSIGSSSGTFRICIGVAYTFFPLEHPAPFFDVNNKKNKKKSMMSFNKYKDVDAHDCVKLSSTVANVDSNNKKLSNFIYWTPGITIPLFDMVFNFKSNCIVCGDFHVQEKGIKCSNMHFICCNRSDGDVSCLIDYIKAAKEPGSVNYVNNDGDLYCPECKNLFKKDCEVVFKVNELDNKNEELKLAFQSLLELKMFIYSEKVANERVEELNVKTKAEQDRINKLEGEEREAAIIKNIIIDDILTLRCPRANCRTAFLDFNGCFALHCSMNNCRAAFCAWCLADCGSDAHAHVNGCRENKVGGLFSTADVFNTHHRERREKKIRELLSTKAVTVKNKVLKLIEKELKDLKINVAF